jgi:hypothetical protein
MPKNIKNWFMLVFLKKVDILALAPQCIEEHFLQNKP